MTLIDADIRRLSPKRLDSFCSCRFDGILQVFDNNTLSQHEDSKSNTIQNCSRN